MPKKIPMRTCIGCGAVKPKKELVRIVLSQDKEPMVDRTGRMAGRGAYLCDDPSCFQRAVKRKSFARSFRTPVSMEGFGLPEADPGEGGTDAG